MGDGSVYLYVPKLRKEVEALTDEQSDPVGFADTCQNCGHRETVYANPRTNRDGSECEENDMEQEPLFTADQLRNNPDAFLDTHLMYGIGDLSEAYHEGRRVERREWKERVAAVFKQLEEEIRQLIAGCKECSDGYMLCDKHEGIPQAVRKKQERVRQELGQQGDGGG